MVMGGGGEKRVTSASVSKTSDIPKHWYLPISGHSRPARDWFPSPLGLHTTCNSQLPETMQLMPPSRGSETPRTPNKSTPRKTLSTSRLYRAPQASIRAGPPPKIVGSSTRRRRTSAGVKTQPFASPVHERKPSDASAVSDIPSVPLLWNEEEESLLSMSPNPFYAQDWDTKEVRWKRSPSRRQRKPHSLHILRGSDDPSEEDASSFAMDHSLEPTSFPRKLAGSWTNLAQLVVMAVLAFMIFESNHRASHHKKQMEQYDEERAHILEQMMWIDKAAKKVHEKYNGAPDGLNLDAETHDELKKDVEHARSQLEQIQLRIQANARDRLQSKFGERPAQVMIQLNESGEHMVVDLSDDAPHAVSTFIQQVDQGFWNEVFVAHEQKSFAEVSSRAKETSPLLEFTEKSRGCHEKGTVALRQMEELHRLVLQVNLEENAHMDQSSVCIGRLISGMDVLQAYRV